MDTAVIVAIASGVDGPVTVVVAVTLAVTVPD